MEKIHIVNPIHVILPEKEVFFRMKYNIHKTEMTPEYRGMIKSVMDRAFLKCSPQGRWSRLKIIKNTGNLVEIEGGHIIEGKSVCDLLLYSSSIVFMCVSVGSEITDDVARAIAEGRGVDALIFDAVGSETAEASMDWLNSYILQQLKRRGETLTKRRFSPGYGDLILENQKLFHSLLDMGDMNVTVTEKCMMIPEKTVTALAGIE